MTRSLLDRSNFVNTYGRIFDDKVLKNITFIVTHECNLRCSYCYEINKSDREMTLDIGKKCIDLLFETDLNNGIWVNPDEADGVILDFIGGEPLLKIDLIDQLMDYFLTKAVELNHRWMIRYMISMSTNGVLYQTEPVQQFLRKWKGRVSIGVTLDGDKETHDMCRIDCEGRGSYDLASAAFNDIIQQYGMTGTKFTIAPGNVDRVFIAHADMIERYNTLQIMSNCVYEEGWTIEHASILYHQLKQLTDWLIDTGRDLDVKFSLMDNFIGVPLSKNDTQNWCGSTGKMLAFDVDGTAIPCVRYSSMSLGRNIKSLPVGDTQHGIGSTDKELSVINLMNSITRQSQSTDICLECPIAAGCAWCSAYYYERSGTPNKRIIFTCEMHIARILATSYYYNSIYRQHNQEDRFPVNVPKEWALLIISSDEYDMLIELADQE